MKYISFTNYNHFFDRVIHFLEINYDNLNFDIFVFDKTFYEIYALFIYITYNFSKMFIYFFITFRRFKNINL